MFYVCVNKTMSGISEKQSCCCIYKIFMDASCICRIYTCFIKDKINKFIPVNTCSTYIYIYINNILHSVKWGRFKKYNNIV